MNKIWKLSLHSYLGWLLSYKQFISICMLLFIHQTVLQPMISLSKALDAPIHITEPFIALANSPIVVSVLIIGYIILIIDLPVTSGNHTFIIWRASRLQWLFSQFLFTLMSALTYFTSAFLITAMSILSRSDWGGSWSQPAAALTSSEAQKYISEHHITVFVPRDLFYSSNPWDSAVNSYFLMILSVCLIAFILIFFSMKNIKMYGVILTISMTLIGLGFSYFVHALQWLFPVPNSIYRLHFYEVLCIYKPIYSYLYLIAANAVFVVLSCISVRTFSFSFSIDDQEGK